MWSAVAESGRLDEPTSISAQEPPTRHRLADLLSGAPDLLLYRFFRLLPTDWGSALGGKIGELSARRTTQANYRAARENYLLLAPDDAAEDDADGAMRRLWNNMGRTMAEFAVIERFWTEGRIAVAGAENLTDAQARGPVIVVGLHLGNWETIGLAMSGLGFPFKAVYQAPHSRFRHEIVKEARQRAFGDIIKPPGAATARELHRTLMAGGMVGIFADEYIRGRVNAPLFGREPLRRSNIAMTARLALATGASVVPAYALRVGGARFRVTFCPPLTLDREADPLRAALALDAAIEPLVRAHLDQWYYLDNLRLN